MKSGQASRELLAPISAAPSVTEGLREALRRLVAVTGSTAGVVALLPQDHAPIVVARGSSAPLLLRRWLTDVTASPARGTRLTRVVPPGSSRSRPAALLRAPLDAGGRRVGELALLGRVGKLTAAALPASFPRELGAAIDRRCDLERLARRAEVVNGLMTLLASPHTLEEVFAAFADGVARLVRFDAISVALLDAERGAFESFDLAAGALRGSPAPGTWTPLEGTLLERVVATGAPVRIDDLEHDDTPEASRRVFADRGYRALTLVPLSSGTVFGAVALATTRPGALRDADLEVVAEITRPLALGIERWRLADESRRRARETHALLEAGRAVTASLDVGRTIRVLLEEARGVLGVDSCGLLTIDPGTDELVMAASLDVPAALVSTIRLRPGQGVTGLAVQQRRPMQSPDLWADTRAMYPHLARGSGFRSMLVAPLIRGEHAIGAISVLRHDVHEFSAHEEELLVALASQAAIALEHARLYTELEGMVADRTRELDAQKRFVEVVLETMPIGVLVLDAHLNVVRINRAGARALACASDAHGPLAQFLPHDTGAPVLEFLGAAFNSRRGGSVEEEMIIAGDAKIFRFTVAPVVASSDRGAYAVVLVEDITRAKGLERQMLLTERLTTAGRLAAGVAHELNNPLATIAGCAESLQGQLRQVCLGLASNALEAMEGRGTLTIRSRRAHDSIEIELEDEGPGISEENLARIFHPFFTTKPPGQGTGLGLAIAQGIVTDHGGKIDVTSGPGKGSTFRVVLPL